MHDDMPYDPIQGQGHETFKFQNLSIFETYLLLEAGKRPLIINQSIVFIETMEQYLFCMDHIFLYLSQSFLLLDFEQNSVLEELTISPVKG